MFTFEDIRNVINKYILDVNIVENATCTAVSYLEDGQVHFEKNILYIGSSSQISQINVNFLSCNFVICCAKTSEYKKKLKSHNVIFLNSTCNVDEVYSNIKKYFDSKVILESKKQRVLSLSLYNLNYQQLANKLSAIANNPVAISNINFKTLGYSNKPVDDFIWNEYTVKDYKPVEYLNIVKEFGLGAVFESDEPAWSAEKSPYPRRLGCKIADKGEMLGWVTIVEHDNKISDTDIPLLKLISEVLCAEFRRDMSFQFSAWKKSEHILADLLNENVQNYNMFKERANQIKLNIDEYIYVLAIKAREDYKHSLIITRKEIETILLNCIAIIYAGSLIVFFTNEKKCLDRTSMCRLSTYMSANHLVGGVSNSYNDIMNAKKYTNQALKAIELGDVLNRESTLHYYEDYSVYHLFNSISQTDNLKDYIDPVINELSTYDEKNATEWLKTLKHFFECNRNYAQTAKIMHIHRNTAMYRITKMQEALGFDINDAQVIFNLQLGLKLHEYCNGHR